MFGLSEVRFMTIPVHARMPSPGDGEAGVAVDATLSWRAGREVAEHHVFLSADQQAVIDGSASPMTVSTSSYGPLSLDLATTYYWRVDEVNSVATTAEWPGAVWSFTTGDSLVIDDFESYGNESPDFPFQAWLDGIGYEADEHFPAAYAGNDTGAAVGHDIWTAGTEFTSIMETAIYQSGSQSMPLYYDNTGIANSQTDRNLPAGLRDWTQHGITTLVVSFYGTAGNNGQLYVKIGNTKVSYPGSATDLAAEQWTSWEIDLGASGASLGNVNTLSIGVEGSDAAGLLYIDDVLLK
jgi:hypothetical protein